jgi:hypothetical protein
MDCGEMIISVVFFAIIWLVIEGAIHHHKG